MLIDNYSGIKMSRSKRRRLIKNNLTKIITTTVIATGVYIPFGLSIVYAEELRTFDKQIIETKSGEAGIVGWRLEDKEGNIIEGYGLEAKKSYEPPEKVKPEVVTKLTNEIDNSYIYKNEKEENIKTLWVKEIIPPRMGENGDFTKEIVGTKKYYVTSQDKGNGWYDVNKPTGNLNIDDFALCGGATASNMLHWWLEQNQDYVDKFIKENPKNGILEFNGEKRRYKRLIKFI